MNAAGRADKMPLEWLFDAPLDLTARLRISVALCAALNQLHQRGAAAGALDPARIPVNLATDQVWLPGACVRGSAHGDLACLGAVLHDLFTWRIASCLAPVPA